MTDQLIAFLRAHSGRLGAITSAERGGFEVNLSKWRIKRSGPELGRKWGVFDPGSRWIPLAWFDTHADAVEYLRSVQQWRERGFR